MNVVCPIIAGSGVEVFHQRLARGLARSGIETRIVKLSRSWEYFPWGLPLRFRLHPLRDSHVKLVHTNAELGSFFKRKGVPLVVTIHHSSIDEEYLAELPKGVRAYHRCVVKPLVKRALLDSNRIVAVSRYTQAAINALFEKEFPIEMIYNGIDTEVHRPREQCPGQPGRPVRLFFSGNPSARKGFDLLAPVMTRLGEGYVLNYTTGLRAQRASLLGVSNARCLGRLSEQELVEEINRADISFQPSRREGFGYSVLEAMACGKPVVSARCSSIPELVDEGHGGFLCDKGSVEHMVEAIKRLGTSPELRQSMGDYNRRKVLQKFTLEKMASAYLHVYQETLG